MLTTSPPVITRINARTASEQEFFIAENLDRLAYFAYARYRTHGRGIVGLFPEEFRQKTGHLGKEHLYYFLAGALRPLISCAAQDPAAEPALREEIQHTISFYDPVRSIIVCFLSRHSVSSEQPVNMYLVHCTTPPPLAYAARTN